MNWFQKIAMSIPDALAELGFRGQSPSLDEIKERWKKLMMEHHPDKGGDEALAKRINEAWALLKSSYNPGAQRTPGWQSDPQDWPPYEQEEWTQSPWSAGYRGKEIPEWQTDERSTYNKVNERLGRQDINFCKKEIYEFSKQHGDVSEVTFWAFDGQYSRGVFTVKSNEASLGFGGEVMEDWNSTGANSYATVAVFASFPGENRIKLVRLRGEDVSRSNRWFEHNSFNNNPFNDQKFTREMSRL